MFEEKISKAGCVVFLDSALQLMDARIRQRAKDEGQKKEDIDEEDIAGLVIDWVHPHSEILNRFGDPQGDPRKVTIIDLVQGCGRRRCVCDS